MPVELKLRDDEGLVLSSRGALRAKDKIELNQALLVSPELIKRLRYMIVDVHEESTGDLSASDLQIIADQDRQIAALARPGLVVAIVAPRDVDFGMARMWQVFTEETGWNTMVFRSFADADTWVREQVKERLATERAA
jgi:hypothetical protein